MVKESKPVSAGNYLEEDGRVTGFAAKAARV